LGARHGLVVRRDGDVLCRTAVCYQAVATGEAVAVPGSSGYLEVAVNGGSAGEDLGLAPGAAVTVAL
jgi:S-adenosylmethionine hydrolase